MTAPLIAIVGSYNPERVDQLSLKNVELAPEAGMELGRELAKQGCHIVVYASYPYLLEVDVVSGYVEAKKANPEPGCIQVHYSVKHAQPSFPVTGADAMFEFMPNHNPEWEVSFYRSLREVDGLLMLGGGPSSMTAGVVAIGFSKPIVTVAWFGGHAEKIWGLLREQQKLLTPQEHYLMADQWRSTSAKRYVEILIRQREQLAHEDQERNEQAVRTEEALRAQLKQREDEFNDALKRQHEKLQREFEENMQAIQVSERNNQKMVKRYALVSAVFLVLALALWVVAYGAPDSVIWLVILLLASPLAAGVSGSTIQVAFGALGIGQTKPTEAQPELPPVITSAAMGLVGGGITTLLYIITQLVAIGDVIQPIHYRRLIPFALCTGFAAGFALDVVARKLRDTAQSGVPSAFAGGGSSKP